MAKSQSSSSTGPLVAVLGFRCNEQAKGSCYQSRVSSTCFDRYRPSVNDPESSIGIRGAATAGPFLASALLEDASKAALLFQPSYAVSASKCHWLGTEHRSTGKRLVSLSPNEMR
jgi:hypothetical protein